MKLRLLDKKNNKAKRGYVLITVTVLLFVMTCVVSILLSSFYINSNLAQINVTKEKNRQELLNENAKIFEFLTGSYKTTDESGKETLYYSFDALNDLFDSKIVYVDDEGNEVNKDSSGAILAHAQTISLKIKYDENQTVLEEADNSANYIELKREENTIEYNAKTKDGYAEYLSNYTYIKNTYKRIDNTPQDFESVAVPGPYSCEYKVEETDSEGNTKEVSKTAADGRKTQIETSTLEKKYVLSYSYSNSNFEIVNFVVYSDVDVITTTTYQYFNYKDVKTTSTTTNEDGTTTTTTTTTKATSFDGTEVKVHEESSPTTKNTLSITSYTYTISEVNKNG